VTATPEYRALFGQGTQGALALYRHTHDHRHDGAAPAEAPSASEIPGA
jgi:zinc transport system ATP-binding protein